MRHKSPNANQPPIFESNFSKAQKNLLTRESERIRSAQTYQKLIPYSAQNTK
jgi:hypothetical protein